MAQRAPYGTWVSPITPDSLTKTAASIVTVFVDPVTKELYYLQSRPSEGGRQVLVKFQGAGEQDLDLFGAEFNASTAVHDYGGVPATFRNNVVYFSNLPDNRVYTLQIGAGGPGPAVPVTPDNPNFRYAELTVVPEQPHILIAVLEDHTHPEPANVVNKLVAINTTDQSIQTIAEGADFYAFPRVSPDGTKLLWIEWYHPDMPWTGTLLVLADFSITQSTVNVTNPHQIAGQKIKNSIQQPNWLTNDRVLYLSDQTGYINPWSYQISTNTNQPNAPEQSISEDFMAMPAWLLGDSDYAVLSGSLVVHSSLQEGYSVFSIWDLEKKAYVHAKTPYSHILSVKPLSSTELIFIGNKPNDTPAIVKLTVGKTITDEPTYDVLKSTWTNEFPRELISIPESSTFPVPPSQKLIHAVYYPPNNPGFEPLIGELPPVLVVLHGGPTARFPIIVKWTIQFWTSRGWAVLDVVYGGSSGYGREYMDRLESLWGIVDVDDTLSAIKYFIDQGRVDGNRIAIRGESSSGLTSLDALIQKPTFIGAGTSTYGVSDLLKLGEETHKFESHYLTYLLGGTPSQVMDVYIQRSPVTHADKIKTPLLIMQGLDDKVVPPEQSALIVKKIQEAGGTVEYITFPGEGHGWRKADTIRKAQQAELDWYNAIFQFGKA